MRGLLAALSVSLGLWAVMFGWFFSTVALLAGFGAILLGLAVAELAYRDFTREEAEVLDFPAEVPFVQRERLPSD